MKATILGAGALVSLLVSDASVFAQPTHYPAYCSPVFRQRLGIAPDAAGPGFYFASPNYYPASCDPMWTVYGPNHCVYPPFAPFNGILSCRQPGGAGQGQGPQAYPYHPYMRSPRDFFMWRETMEDQMRRDSRPSLIP